MSRVKQICYFLFFFILFSCTKKVSTQEFLDVVNSDEDFVKKYDDSVYRLSCTYKPGELMALSELRGDLEKEGKLDEKKYAEAKKNFLSGSYFILKMGLQDHTDIFQSGLRNKAEYAMRVNEFTFNMNKYFYMLTESKDTVRASIYDFQRSYGMSPDVTVLFAFPSESIREKGEAIELVYEDRFFGIERPVRFRFETDKLNKELPQVKID